MSGCIYDNVSGLCNCSHLTAFVLVDIVQFIPTPTLPSARSLAHFADAIFLSPLACVVIATMLALCAALMVAMRCIHRKRRAAFLKQHHPASPDFDAFLSGATTQPDGARQLYDASDSAALAAYNNHTGNSKFLQFEVGTPIGAVPSDWKMSSADYQVFLSCVCVCFIFVCR